MIIVSTLSLLMLGAPAPAVSLEVKAIGLDAERTGHVTQRLHDELALLGYEVGAARVRLKVTLIRAGSVLRVHTRLRAKGKTLLEDRRRARDGTLLTPALRDKLAELTQPVVIEQPKPTPPPVIAPVPSPGPELIEVETAPAGSPLLVAGGTSALAVGALFSLGAASVTAHEVSVLNDAGAQRSEKDRALSIGPASAGAALVGGVVAIIGTGMLLGGL